MSTVNLDYFDKSRNLMTSARVVVTELADLTAIHNWEVWPLVF